MLQETVGVPLWDQGGFPLIYPPELQGPHGDPPFLQVHCQRFVWNSDISHCTVPPET